MNRMISILFVAVALSFLSCTRESKIKSLALDAAELYYSELLKQESEKAIQGKPTYKANYVSSVKAKTEYEIEKIDIQDSTASSIIQITSWPDKVRWAALEIVEKRSNENGYSMNISDALGMIGAQKHLDASKPILKVIIKLKLENSDWKTISVEKINLK